MLKKLCFLLTILLAISFAVLLQGCNDTGKSKDTDKSTMLTYEEYLKLINKIYNGYTPKGFKRVDKDENKVDLIAINKEATFDKRVYLTLTGEQTAQSTQRTLTFKDDKSKNLLYVSIIYLNKSLSNDMVYMHLPPENIENDIITHYDEDIISYNNILIKSTLFTDTGTIASKTDIIKDNTIELVKFLKGYIK